MGYSVRKITLRDNEDEWFPKSSGRWEIVDDHGTVVYKFKWKHTGDHAEWDDRDWYQGPMQVRISADGQWVECVLQTGVKHGISFPGTLGERIERHPLPPVSDLPEEE